MPDINSYHYIISNCPILAWIKFNPGVEVGAGNVKILLGMKRIGLQANFYHENSMCMSKLEPSASLPSEESTRIRLVPTGNAKIVKYEWFINLLIPMLREKFFEILFLML